MFDTVIIGGGPAAVAAGVYAARKQIKTAFFANQIGGQSVVSDEIENWIGEAKISGPALAKKLREHLESQKENIELHIGENVDEVQKKDDGTFVVIVGNKKFETRTVIVCTGGRHRRLGIPGEEKFEGRGVAFCATCDAAFFRGKDVAIVGGGNSGLEAVVDLMPFAKKIYLIARKPKGGLRGDPITQKKVIGSDQVEVIYDSNAIEVLGEQMVSGLRYKNTKDNEEKEIEVNGVFVEIGSVPNSEIVGAFVKTDDWNNIIVNCATQETSCPGVFAAGDVTNAMYRQNNIAVGDAIKALLSAHEYIKKIESK